MCVSIVALLLYFQLRCPVPHFVHCSAMRATTAHVAREGGGPRSSLKAIVAKLQEAYELLEASVKDVLRALRSSIPSDQVIPEGATGYRVCRCLLARVVVHRCSCLLTSPACLCLLLSPCDIREKGHQPGGVPRLAYRSRYPSFNPPCKSGRLQGQRCLDRICAASAGKSVPEGLHVGFPR